MKNFAINTQTTQEWSFEETLVNYKNMGIPAVGIVYDKIRNRSIDDITNIVNVNNLAISNLSLTGFFTLPKKEIEKKPFCIVDPYYAIDLANKIKAETLLVIAGPPDFDNGGIKAAEDIVLENLEKLSRYAEEKNIKLGLEVIHPMYIDTWSAVTTIDQAMNIIDKINSKNVGLFLDTYHIFWDPNLYESLERASGKIFGVHINDWKYPTTGFMERVVMGQGIIPIENIIKEIYNNGYRGYFEVEILSGEISSNDYKNIIKNAVDYYKKFLLKYE